MLEMEREEVAGGHSRASAERVQSTPVQPSTNAGYEEHHAD